MKIILNKFDYATIVRNCAKTRDGYDGCSKCALNGVCDGPDSLEESCSITGCDGPDNLEESCSITGASLFEMGYIHLNMPNDEAVSETN